MNWYEKFELLFISNRLKHFQDIQNNLYEKWWYKIMQRVKRGPIAIICFQYNKNRMYYSMVSCYFEISRCLPWLRVRLAWEIFICLHDIYTTILYNGNSLKTHRWLMQGRTLSHSHDCCAKSSLALNSPQFWFCQS